MKLQESSSGNYNYQNKKKHDGPLFLKTSISSNRQSAIKIYFMANRRQYICIARFVSNFFHRDDIFLVLFSIMLLYF